jgi:two-component sensor histidine kinase
MATRARAREIYDRSLGLLDRSRVVAARLLDPPRDAGPKAIEAVPGAWGDAVRHESLVDVCASIALRDLNLIDTLLAELEEMERREDDSTRLGQLYRIDHLATRLRRNAENLRVLADRDAGDSGGDTTSILDTVRAAMSSIDQYARIGIGRMVSLGVVGFASDDLSRVLAELLDNAANHSPPSAQVRVSAHLTEQGSVLIRIEDGGIGLPPDRLADLNGRLSRALRLDDDAVRHMGLAVIRRLAERHDLRVSLHRRVPNGTTATVLVPPSLVTELPEEGWSGSHTVPTGRRHRYAVPEPREAAPVPAAQAVVDELAATAAAGLPRRGARPAPRPMAPSVSGTTPSGLPRRVSRSIKDATEDGAGVGAEDGAEVGPEHGSPPDPEPAAPDPDGHEKFLADLGDFADGEQAAHADGGVEGGADAGEDGGRT